MASLSRNYLGFFGVVLLGTVWSSGATAADQGEGQRLATAFAAPSGFPQGPSLRETGRIGAMFPQGSGEIVRDDQRVSPADVTVQQVAMVDRTAGRSGVEDDGLTREIAARLAAAQGCRIEVARRKQVAPSEVVSAPMTLRWTILPSGAVSSTAVAITTVEDADLADCVKRQMVSWNFPRLSGGPVNVERIFQLNQR